jgi:hypothetical protein
VVGGWWLVVGGWWLVVGGWWLFSINSRRLTRVILSSTLSTTFRAPSSRPSSMPSIGSLGSTNQECHLSICSSTLMHRLQPMLPSWLIGMARDVHTHTHTHTLSLSLSLSTPSKQASSECKGYLAEYCFCTAGQMRRSNHKQATLRTGHRRRLCTFWSDWSRTRHQASVSRSSRRWTARTSSRPLATVKSACAGVRCWWLRSTRAHTTKWSSSLPIKAA